MTRKLHPEQERNEALFAMRVAVALFILLGVCAAILYFS